MIFTVRCCTNGHLCRVRNLPDRDSLLSLPFTAFTVNVCINRKCVVTILFPSIVRVSGFAVLLLPLQSTKWYPVWYCRLILACLVHIRLSGILCYAVRGIDGQGVCVKGKACGYRFICIHRQGIWIFQSVTSPLQCVKL